MLSAAATTILSICVLVVLGGALIAWAVVQQHRSPFTPVQTLLYGLNYLMARILWRGEIVGRVSLPPDQGAVIVCNHRSPVDPSFLILIANRVTHWFVAREFYTNPACGWFLRICEVIPVNRGRTDTAATKAAIRYLREGSLVGLFIEGYINESDRFLLPGRPGAAMIARRARVPVIPCYVSGAPYDGTWWGCLFMPAKVRLVVGDPIDVSPYCDRGNRREALQDLTKRLLVEIARLAGEEDFQPELAGRFPQSGSADD